VTESESQSQLEFDTPDPTDEDMRTGVPIGASIPPFEAVDADGKAWNFDAIKGPRGALLLFYRSADW
jgi:hypothetical protein